MQNYVELRVPYIGFIYPRKELLVYFICQIILPLSTMEYQQLSQHSPVSHLVYTLLFIILLHYQFLHFSFH